MHHRMTLTRAALALGLTTVVALAVLAARRPVSAAADLAPGKVDLKSAGALAFGPDGVLFVGDSVGGAVVALDTDDRTPAHGARKIDVAGRRREDRGARRRGARSDHDQRRGGEPDFEERLRLGVARPRPRCHAARRARRRLGQADAAVARQHRARLGQPGRRARRHPGARQNPRTLTITDMAYVERQPDGGRHVERGVVVGAALDPVSVQDRGQGHAAPDLARLARPVRDAGAGAHVRAVHAWAVSSTSWRPTPARRS